MKACVLFGVLLLVFAGDPALSQQQDLDDVINMLDIDENITSTGGLIGEVDDVTTGNGTAGYCESFTSNETVDLEALTWPRAQVGSTVGVAQQSILCGAKVFRNCSDGGQWSEIVEIETCLADEVLLILVEIGCSVSLLACIIAFLMFMLTRSSLRGLGHYHYHIHWNLISSFIFYLVIFLIRLAVRKTDFTNILWLRNLLTALLAYFVMANFFWMLVEGLVLFVLVATSFPKPQRGRAFVKWLIIGWGIPAGFVTAWIIVERAITPEDGIFVLNVNKTEASNYACLIGPILGALVINGIVLVIVIRILWLKLRADIRNSTNESHKNSWRAAKSTFVILILLGVYYALPILVSLFNPPVVLAYAVIYVSGLVNSLQGLAVCTLYVFCNAEVRRALRNYRRKISSRSNITFTTRLSSPSSSRSATPRHSKSHSSSEGSCKRPIHEGEDIEMRVTDHDVNANVKDTPKRQMRVVMESLAEEPSDCESGYTRLSVTEPADV